MSKSKVYRMNETIIVEALIGWKTVVEEALVILNLLGLIGLIMVALGIIISRNELRSFF
mgnify:CR=1 FL=1